ncbi:MAG TPA: polymer-forming cytoskeletal protein [Hyphomicrobiaceae bacterium]|nr:polymer-forming cytoskeletal protein [Hyphomicrobiaceae bacterium]
MFTKKPDRDTPPPIDLTKSAPPIPPPITSAPRPASSRPSTTSSVIGPDLTVMGNIVSKGGVQIDGEIQGDLHAMNVVVGENARITGGIIADEVIVRGTVMGSIRGRSVSLQSSSKVEGDVYHQSLAIEQGAYFEGKSRRSEDPLASTTRPDGPLTNGAASTSSSTLPS